ncbi:MAG: hypothetical protein H7Y59_08190 [Anaerolineales bacterium]|nr:hypothetical protein [Anaerolineales bacterium]
MKTKLPIMALTSILILAACAPATPIEPTPDVLAIRTSAAYTVVAEFTLTASAFTPTALPPTETPIPELPTETATLAFATDPTQIALGTPGAPCNDLSIDNNTVDVTILDGTQMTPGQEFVKTWKIKNTGICTWGEGYGLLYLYGERMNGQPIPLSVVVEVGQEVEVSVTLKAPDQVGSYISAWQMATASGVPFGVELNCKIIVQ